MVRGVGGRECMRATCVRRLCCRRRSCSLLCFVRAPRFVSLSHCLSVCLSVRQFCLSDSLYCLSSVLLLSLPWGCSMLPLRLLILMMTHAFSSLALLIGLCWCPSCFCFRSAVVRSFSPCVFLVTYSAHCCSIFLCHLFWIFLHFAHPFYSAVIVVSVVVVFVVVGAITCALSCSLNA